MQKGWIALLVALGGILIFQVFYQGGAAVLDKELEPDPEKRRNYDKIKEWLIREVSWDAKKSRPELVQEMEMVIARHFPNEYPKSRGNISAGLHKAFWLTETGQVAASDSNAQLKSIFRTANVPADYLSRSGTKLV